MDKDNIYFSKSAMSFDSKLTPIFSSSASEHNVYLTYVCLINDGLPKISNLDKKDDTEERDAVENDGDSQEFIQVERSKAVYELVQSIRKKDQSGADKLASTSGEDSETSDLDEFNKYDNPKVLKLTKMKWLSEGKDGYPDSSSPSVSSMTSTASSKAEDSDDEVASCPSIGEKYLSTILRLDKEHNLFGLSSIAVVGSKQSRSTKQTRKDDQRPVFHQTAIVQVCCPKSCRTCCTKACCKNRSNTDLPSSLKCGGCHSCLLCCYPSPCTLPSARPSTMSCTPTPVAPPSCALIPRHRKIHTCCLPDAPKTKPCNPCPAPLTVQPLCLSNLECTCGLTAFVPPPEPDCCFGLRVKVTEKPTYVPTPIEITPRCSSVLQKPIMARECTHNPHCEPPSSYFPYLMPCYWPCRPSAPCLDPSRCFHSPPCLPPRRVKGPPLRGAVCPKPGPCNNKEKNTTCQNIDCLGRTPGFEATLTNWGAPDKNKKPETGKPPVKKSPPEDGAPQRTSALKPSPAASKPPSPPSSTK